MSSEKRSAAGAVSKAYFDEPFGPLCIPSQYSPAWRVNGWSNAIDTQPFTNEVPIDASVVTPTSASGCPFPPTE
ncbi:MAG: hypothetical protein DYH12_16095 [Sorangiineae bacterium PRO1]|nr:hypothetical protein [Sorangiineae bacterium PRO1]